MTCLEPPNCYGSAKYGFCWSKGRFPYKILCFWWKIKFLSPFYHILSREEPISCQHGNLEKQSKRHISIIWRSFVKIHICNVWSNSSSFHLWSWFDHRRYIFWDTLSKVIFKCMGWNVQQINKFVFLCMIPWQITLTLEPDCSLERIDGN